MKILAVSDLHYRLPHFDWLVGAADGVDVVAVVGDLADVVSPVPHTVQSVVLQYLQSVRPMHERFVEPARSTADLVLGWQHTPAEWAATVVATLRGRMSQLL